MKESLSYPYTSTSFSSILAAVTAGLAVTALCRSVLPTGVRPLGVEEGFPPLPQTALTLHRGKPISAVAECLAGYICEGFSGDISATHAADRSPLAASAGYQTMDSGEPVATRGSPPPTDSARPPVERRPGRGGVGDPEHFAGARS